MENALQIVAAAGKNVKAQYVEMLVPLYSYGCETKVKKALTNLKGIYSVNVDFHQQKVTVWGICDKYEVLSRVKRKRKESCFWNPEDNIQLQESRSAPPSPSLLPKTRYSEIIKKVPSLNLRLAMAKGTTSLKWKALKKAFTRSNSF